MTCPRIIHFAPWAAVDSDISAIDYIRALSVRLQPQLTFVKGELTIREFYATATMNPDGTQTFVDRVVREDYVYTRNTNGLVSNRVMTITWYNDDDTVALVKSRSKFYTPMEGLREGKRFRGNVIDQLQIDTLFLIMTTTGWTEAVAQAAGAAFMLSIQTETMNYLEADDSAGLTAAINAAPVGTYTWLDNIIDPGPPVVTIRSYLVAGLS